MSSPRGLKRRTTSVHTKAAGKQRWMLVAYPIMMAAVTACTLLAVEIALAFVLIHLLGSAAVSQPVWQTIYSALVYVLTIMILLWVPRHWKGIVAKFKGLCGGETATKKVAKKPRATSGTPVSGAGNAVKRFFAKMQDFADRMKPACRNVGLNGLPTWADIGLSIVGLAAGMILAAVLIDWFQNFAWFDANAAQEIGYSSYIFGVDRLLAFVTLVIIAPIAEEILFRGWMYGKLRDFYYGKLGETVGIIISIIVTSVVFGVVHGQWNVGVTVFALSVVMCLLREITGSIHAGILMHMLKNGMAFYAIFVIHYYG